MLEITIHPEHEIHARTRNNTTWITAKDEHGHGVTIFVDERSAVEIVERLARAFPDSTLKLQLEWLDAMHRNAAANAVPTSTLTEEVKI